VLWRSRSDPLRRVAVAPWSWGVCDVPGWGVQLPASRLRAEARELGVRALEAGPEGYLERQRGLQVPVGFLSAAIHRSALPRVERYCAYLERLGAELLVVAPAGERPGYELHSELDARGWAELFDAIGGMTAVAHRHGLDLAVHPHFGTLLENHAQLERFLVASEAPLCLDLGDLALAGIDPLELIELAPRRIRHVHLKDVDRRLVDAVREHRHGYWEALCKGMYRPLEQGDGAAGAVIEALRAAGYEGRLSVEVETVLAAEPPPGTGPCEAVAASLDYLRRALG
jgi:inosose dehydratase